MSEAAAELALALEADALPEALELAELADADAEAEELPLEQPASMALAPATAATVAPPATNERRETSES